MRARLYFALMLAATAALSAALLVYLLYAANVIPFPYDYDQGEGFEVQDTVYFSRSELPYRDTESYPFYSSNYPPLFHVLAAPFVWIFGPAHWYGRALGFLGSLLSAGTIGYAVWRDGGGQRWIALLSAFAFLSSNFVYHIGPLFRQHTLMVTFETLAVVLLAGAFPKRQRRRIALAMLLLGCAGYTKQLAAISAAAACLWMFLRQPRRGTAWTAVFALAGGAVFAWLFIASDGQWWTQAIVANVNDFLFDQASGLFVLWFKLHGALLIPAALLLLYETYFERLSIYSIWFVFSALLGGVASGTWGAGDSYFVTSIAAACILSGIMFSRVANQCFAFPGRLRALPVMTLCARGLILIPLLYLGYARATLKLPTDGAFAPAASLLGLEANIRGNFYDSASFDVGGYARIGYFLSAADWEAGAQISERIRQSDKPALSEDAGFSLAAGRDVISNPTQLRNLHLAGLFTGAELIGMIERQDFGLIVLRALFYPPAVLQAIDRHYIERERIHMNGFDYLLLYAKETEA